MDVLNTPAPRATKRIAYGTNPLHFGDLRLPEGKGPFPVVVNIHGGFWRAQYDLEHAGHLCEALTREGIATWNIEYRRLGNAGGGWTGTFEDVGQAVDFLPTLADQYPLDLSRTVVMGHSAGGHLALWAAARRTFSDANPFYSATVLAFQGVVALAPVADLALAWRLGLSNTVVAQLLGGSPTSHPDRYALASPIELLPLGVPQIVVHGTQDDIVPMEIAERYCDAARAKGDECRLARLPHAGHFEVIDPTTPQWQVVEKAVKQLL